MIQPHIYFAHANGFPAASYHKLFQGLRQHGYSIEYLDQHGHNPHFPVTNNWSYLADELIAELELRDRGPVIGVGHSLGGLLCSFAAARRPELFSSVIMLDSFVLSTVEKVAVSMAKRLGLIDHMTPAGRTKDRRVQWPSRDAAREYFSRKKLFRHFDPECVEHYLDAGLKKDTQGVALTYRTDIEVSIYRNMPHRTPSGNSLYATPTGLMYGDRSDVMIKHRIRAGERNPRLTMQKVEGSHMFPLEHPSTTAHHIHAMIKRLTHQGESSVALCAV